MASVNVTGVLKTPADEIATNVPILLISKIGYGNTLASSNTTQYTDAAGNYDFPLVHGTHSIAVRFEDRYVTLGTVVVNSSTPSPRTINELLEMTTAPIQPEWVTYVEELTARAEDAAQASQKSANDSAGSAIESSEHSNDSAGFANEALGYRNEAKQFRDEAEQISGLDRVEEAVDAAIDNRNFMVMTEAQAQAEANQNLRKYPASGFVEYGKHVISATAQAVNEGITTQQVVGRWENAFAMGATQGSGVGGTSKTSEAATHIAGYLSRLDLTGWTGDGSVKAFFELPEAEKGYRTYDSTVGTSFNYRTQTDPKYGDIAGADDEAVSRAWEGAHVNNDVRFGTDYMIPNTTMFAWDFNRTDNSTTYDASTNQWTVTEQAGSDRSLIMRTPVGVVVGEYYKVSFKMIAKSTGVSSAFRFRASGSAHWTGGDQMVGAVPVGGTAEAIYQCASVSSGSYISLLVSATDASITIQDFTLHRCDVNGNILEEVVVDRHDIPLLELYHELVTDNEVFPFCIQNESNSVISGIPMVLSARKKSYFQVFDDQYGDPDATNDTFYCWDWSTLSIAQKEQVAKYLGSTLYVAADGTDRLVNVRIRKRTIAGVGNGDWLCTSSVDTWNRASTCLSFGLSGTTHYRRTVVNPQGHNNVPLSRYAPDGKSIHANVDTGSSGKAVYRPSTSITDPSKYRGVFEASDWATDTYGYNGECYALVLGVVKRKNQGKTHPFNEQGAALCSDSNRWHNTTDTITSQKDCFISPVGGNIASGQSGADDGSYYDGIKASGHGGMYDMRMSASDITPYMGEIREKVKAGKYRGKEKVIFMTPCVITDTGSTYGNVMTPSGAELRLQDCPASLINKYRENGGFGASSTMTTQQAGICANVATQTYFGTSGATELMRVKVNTGGNVVGDIIYVPLELNSTVSGSFATKMVIGDPANILQTPQLQEGWEGTWCPSIPTSGTSDIFPMTRKALVTSNLPTQRTTDNGTTWTSLTANIDPVTNLLPDFLNTGWVGIIHYTAYAAQTEPTTNGVVYQGEEGVKDVFATSDYREVAGCLLAESVLGKVLTNNAGSRKRDYKLTSVEVWETGVIGSSALAVPKHVPIELTAPINNSPAVKALAYDSVVNQQMQPHFAFNELVWNRKNPETLDGTATSQQTVSANTPTVVVGGNMAGHTLWSATEATLTPNNYYVDGSGAVVAISNGFVHATLKAITYTGWNDDSTMRITDNVGTYNTLNGDVALYGTHKLSIPCGWVAQVATAGESDGTSTTVTTYGSYYVYVPPYSGG